MLFLNIIKTNDTSIFINNLIFCNYLNIFTLPKHENLRKKSNPIAITIRINTLWLFEEGFLVPQQMDD